MLSKRTYGNGVFPNGFNWFRDMNSIRSEGDPCDIHRWGSWDSSQRPKYAERKLGKDATGSNRGWNYETPLGKAWVIPRPLTYGEQMLEKERGRPATADGFAKLYNAEFEAERLSKMNHISKIDVPLELFLPPVYNTPRAKSLPVVLAVSIDGTPRQPKIVDSTLPTSYNGYVRFVELRETASERVEGIKNPIRYRHKMLDALYSLGRRKP